MNKKMLTRQEYSEIISAEKEIKIQIKNIDVQNKLLSFTTFTEVVEFYRSGEAAKINSTTSVKVVKDNNLFNILKIKEKFSSFFSDLELTNTDINSKVIITTYYIINIYTISNILYINIYLPRNYKT